jgi:sarcosine oxidase gamma subunit
MIVAGGRDTYRVSRIRGRRGGRRGRVAGVRVGAPDEWLTKNAGLVAVTELAERLDLVAGLDAAVGPIKVRDRGFSAGQVLVGMMAAQLAGEDFLVGLDRQRADAAGQVLAPVPGLASTTAAELAQRFTPGQWVVVEQGVAAATETMMRLVPARRAFVLSGQATIDLDTTDVEVYGRLKRGVAFNYAGQRVGRPHVAIWAETTTVLAADLLCGDTDPRPGAAGLLRRALACLPARVRRVGKIRLRTDAGYMAGQLARAAHEQGVEFAIGAKRMRPLWRMLAGLAETDWTDAIEMTGAQVAVANYRPDWWPADTWLLIRRVRLDLAAGQVSADLRSRRRRTLHPDQQKLPLAELADADAVYAYSFILTNLDVSTPRKAAEVEWWYRHRTTIENVFRDAKHGAALRHLPSGYPEVNTAWMWGALLAATMAAWFHQLTGTLLTDNTLAGHGVRGGQAMIATLRRRLIAIPARLIRHGRTITLRPPPGHRLLAEVLTRIRALPTPT